MDCFYAAIEIRDRPELAGKPVAVGGTGRGVLTTCNYEARRFGCRSALPAFHAMRLCPDLIILPVRFEAYRKESARIREIFHDFTGLVEPLSLDEAYLDVSGLRSEAGCVADEIRCRIFETTQLTASAGVAPNKFLAKVASDWNKPNGQFEIKPEEAETFVLDLPVENIWGVGNRTAEKMHRLGVKTCGDLRSWNKIDLHRRFGKFGSSLYELCRGRDDRQVNPHRERKSVSNERTFRNNIQSAEEGLEKLDELIHELESDLQKHTDRRIREGFVKLKFEDFGVTSAQQPMAQVEAPKFRALLREAWQRGGGKSVRLIGAGVRFVSTGDLGPQQLDLFEGKDWEASETTASHSSP